MFRSLARAHALISPSGRLTRRLVSSILGVLVASTATSAHVPSVVTPDRLWGAWTFEPTVIGPLAVMIWIYVQGIRRIRARVGRDRAVSATRVLSFSIGVTALVVALVSPLDALGGTLLSAHMAQHGLLAGVAPPLLLIARPGAAFAWGLQPLWMVGPWPAKIWRWVLAASRSLSAPALATVIHGVLLWVWHAPTLFAAAVANDWVHAVQHLCFLLPSFFFWRALLDGESPREAAPAMVGAFVTFVHTGLLGGLLTFAPQVVYPVYAGRPAAWGLTAHDDQQLAGLLMWVPLGLPYLVAGLWLASRVLALDPPLNRQRHS